MALSPQQVTDGASQFDSIPEGLKLAALIYLFQRIEGSGLTVEQLIDGAKCIDCGISGGMRLSVMIFLLNQIAAGGGGGTSQDMQIEWTPTNVKLGEVIGLISFTSNVPGLTGITSLTFNQATMNQAIQFFGDGATDTLQTVSFPNLVSVTDNAFIEIDSFSSLTTLSFPVIVTLTSPHFISNPLLTSFSAPNWIPTNGNTLDFRFNALDATSVNQILSRCVANAGFVAGNVRLSGGTNAAPTGQGIADKATLIGRGVTVSTN